VRQAWLERSSGQRAPEFEAVADVMRKRLEVELPARKCELAWRLCCRGARRRVVQCAALWRCGGADGADGWRLRHCAGSTFGGEAADCAKAGAPAALERELIRGERGAGVLDAPAKCSVLQRAREMKSAAIAAGAHSCGNCQCAMAAKIEVLPRLRRCEAQARRSQERSRRDHPNGCKRGRKGQLDH
jgi:hypothetical protein